LKQLAAENLEPILQRLSEKIDKQNTNNINLLLTRLSQAKNFEMIKE